MPCCKAEKYSWCKDLPVVDHGEEEENEYCIFHAPQGKKGVSVEKFNKLVFERIENAKTKGEQCDLSGTIFEGKISFGQFNKEKPLPEIDFTEAIFSREVDFTKVTFSGKTNFSRATFGGTGLGFPSAAADFSDAIFKSETFFTWCTFSESAYFTRATFSRKVNFIETIFSEWACFTNVKCRGMADFLVAEFRGMADFFRASFGEVGFTGVTFKGEANFIEAAFGEVTYFRRAIFSGTAEFRKAKFTGMVDFEKATFNDETYFKGTTFSGVGLTGAIFNRNVNFKEGILEKISIKRVTFNGSVNFRTAIFREVDFIENTFGETNFERATFSKVGLREVTFSGKVNFIEATFNGEAYIFGKTFTIGADFKTLNIKEKVRLEKVNLEKVSFLDTDLRRMDFINCDWPKKEGRNVLYDEIELFKKGKGKDFRDKIKKVEILYRMLKQKYKEEHNEIEVSNWHYGEKEMYRKSSLFRRYFPLSLSNLYWLSSGYGERPVRSGIVLLLLILAITVLSGLAGLDPNPLNGSSYGINKIEGWADIMNFKNLRALFLNTLQYATFEKEPDFIHKTIYGGYLKLAARILIPLQAALFALAVRNRFRR